MSTSTTSTSRTWSPTSPSSTCSPAATIREIIAQDVLEHLPRTSTVTVLQEWSRLLAEGGSVHLRVPSVIDLAEMMKKPEHQEIAQQELFVQCLFGTQAYTEDTHYTTFTDRLLRHYLAQAPARGQPMGPARRLAVRGGRGEGPLRARDLASGALTAAGASASAVPDPSPTGQAGRLTLTVGATRCRRSSVITLHARVRLDEGARGAYKPLNIVGLSSAQARQRGRQL